MQLNRREFVILTAGLAAGCVGENAAVELKETAIDAGAVADYAADGVYDRFRKQGFFVVREGPKLFAMSAVCTHRHCILHAQPDHSFHCNCHGSEFDPNGKVTEGPATRDLPELPSSVDQNQHLIVRAVAV
jgi:Rieske Fe-S protein